MFPHYLKQVSPCASEKILALSPSEKEGPKYHFIIFELFFSLLSQSHPSLISCNLYTEIMLPIINTGYVI